MEKNKPVRRVYAFVDGFNLYHSIDDLKTSSHLKWLDIEKLIKSSLNSTEKLEKVFYFTALTEWNREKRAKHKIYIQALEKGSVEVIYGRFSKTQKRTLEGKQVTVTEEKETDVNIAINMIKYAYRDEYDQAVLITADSDQVPTIKIVTNDFEKELRLLIPYNRKADELKKNSTFYQSINIKLMEASQLPSRINIENGREIRRPDDWKK